MPWEPHVVNWLCRMSNMVNNAVDNPKEYVAKVSGSFGFDSKMYSVRRIGEPFIMTFEPKIGFMRITRVFLEENEERLTTAVDYYVCEYFVDNFRLQVINRWRDWARKRVRERAANRIRDFYFDYVVPKLYNPHKVGRGFLKLKNKLDSNLL